MRYELVSSKQRRAEKLRPPQRKKNNTSKYRVINLTHRPPNVRPSRRFRWPPRPSLFRFVHQITEAYPDVPWVFVFRDPVEVMVSNLKAFSGAPCVRIPRQEKARLADKQAKLAAGGGERGGGREGGGGGGGGPGGRSGAGGGGPGFRKSLEERKDLRREKKGKFLRDGVGRFGGGEGGGGRKTRRILAAAGETASGGGAASRATGESDGWRAAAAAAEGGALAQETGLQSLPQADSGRPFALWGEEEEGASDPFSSISWNGHAYNTSGAFGSLSGPLARARSMEGSFGVGDGEEEQQRARMLRAGKPLAHQLDMGMTMECADWLKVYYSTCFMTEVSDETGELALRGGRVGGRRRGKREEGIEKQEVIAFSNVTLLVVVL